MAKYPGKPLDADVDRSDMEGQPRAYFDALDWPARFPELWRRTLWRNGGDDAGARLHLADIFYGLHGDVPEAERWAPTEDDRARYRSIIRSCLAAHNWDVRKFVRGMYRHGSTKRKAHYHWRGFCEVAER
ncbi:hypothetical protein [Thermomonas sp.]|uniref:hypothetical protein n=1 Tax=Thermomonas sp. TaxID=1971895 RepID=UPI0035AF13F5